MLELIVTAILSLVSWWNIDNYHDKKKGDNETIQTEKDKKKMIASSFSAKANILKANASMSVTVDTESHKQVDTSTTQKSSDISGSHNITTKAESKFNYGSLLFNKI